MPFRRLRDSIIVVFVLAFCPVVVAAAERVAVVTSDEPTMEEYAAALHLVHHLDKIDGVAAAATLEADLDPGFWRRLADRLRGRDRGYRDADVRVFLKDEGRRMKEEVSGGVLEKRRVGEYKVKKTGSAVYIHGEGIGVLHAVYGFLQDDLGFRWYLPGPLGEVVPEVSVAGLEDFETRREVAFQSRQFSGLRDRQSREWVVRNHFDRTRSHRFHHNVRRIFTPDLFDDHPEVFPLWDGERYRPPENDPNWQPCFGNPKTAEIAAEAAREYFDSNPWAISFSVGMNDGNRICECDLCQGLVDHGRTFRDRPDYSDLVFTFTNRVAELLEETHPDKYIGCLAYHWAENTPSFPVHPRVIPYLTADRAQWIDPRFRAEDEDLMERWMSAGPEIAGIYDYYYGGSYVIPRVFNSVMADSIRHAYDTGIQGFYAELYPRWSIDGPKAWLAARLLREPEADVDALLEDYYETFFGPAAEPMRAYFEFAEERWASQEGRPFWLRYYFDFAQLELYPPEVCVRARAYLDEAVDRAGEREPYGGRVALYAEGFRLTELYSRYYHFIHNLPAERELSETDGWRFLVELMLFAEGFEELKRWKDDVMDHNFLHREGGNRFYERARFKPEMRLSPWVGPLLDWGEAHGAGELVGTALGRLESVFPAARIEAAREIHRLASQRPFATGNLLRNGNFASDRILADEEEYLGVRGRAPRDWSLWWRPGTTSGFFLDRSLTYSGDLALRAEGAIEEFAYVNVPVESDALYLFKAEAQASISNGGQVRIELEWWDDSGALIELQHRHMDRLPEGERTEWERLAIAARPPEGAVLLMASLSVHSQDEDDWAVFDGVRLEEWEGEL